MAKTHNDYGRAESFERWKRFYGGKLDTRMDLLVLMSLEQKGRNLSISNDLFILKNSLKNNYSEFITICCKRRIDLRK